MHRAMTLTMVLGVGLGLRAAQSSSAAGDALLEVLVWGLEPKIGITQDQPEVRAALEGVLRRARAYRSRRPAPKGSREEPMIYEAQVRYERLLAAFADDPNAPALAAGYVDRLKPCYEWEGYHDCPEAEAMFALEYAKANPSAPFSALLPLLAAHRWLCTADAYDYEKRAADAARSRRAYESALGTARQSHDVLVRAGAQALTARGRCFE